MESKRGKLDEATDAVFERLMAGDFKGNAQELADECGIEFEWLRVALARVRSPEWIEENGWTIPYVRRGSWVNTWYVADTSDHADQQRMQTSQYLRALEVRRTTRLNVGQCRLALAALPDKRATAAKQWKTALTMFEAAEAHMELLAESFDENK
jgi:hypothetical protein